MINFLIGINYILLHWPKKLTLVDAIDLSFDQKTNNEKWNELDKTIDWLTGETIVVLKIKKIR